MVLLQKFSDCLGASTDRVGLPRRVHATWFGLVEPGGGIVRVKPDDQGRNTKGTDTSGLGVALLDAGNMARDVVDRHRVFYGETMGLALGARLVDENAGVGGETGKGETDVLVEHGGLTDGAWILELENRLFLYTQDDNILATNSDGARPLADGFEGVFDLKAAQSSTKQKQKQKQTKRGQCRLLELWRTSETMEEDAYRCPSGEKTVSARVFQEQKPRGKGQGFDSRMNAVSPAMANVGD